MKLRFQKKVKIYHHQKNELLQKMIIEKVFMYDKKPIIEIYYKFDNDINFID